MSLFNHQKKEGFSNTIKSTMNLIIPQTTPWTSNTEMRSKIIAGAKIHHIVEGQNWQPEMIVHFYESDTKEARKVNQFFLASESFAESWQGFDYADGQVKREPVCFAVEDFSFEIVSEKDNEKEVQIKVGSLFFTTEEMISLFASNEGFNNHFELIEYYSVILKESNKKKFTGQIVHWTSSVYDYNNPEAWYHSP